MKKKNLGKIKIFFKKAARTTAENTFFSLLGSFLIIVVFGGLVFYHYVILTENKIPEVTEQPLQFEERNYKNILTIWQEREKNLEAAGKKMYPSPFSSVD